MKLLLHTCCAPCLMYPLERLRGQGFEVSGFFYNPNIHPMSEYENRKQAVSGFGKNNRIDIDYPEYNPEQYFQVVNLKEDSPKRCSLCWSLRLERTAKSAREKGLEYFTTTLLVSPYQNQELLKNIGEDIAKNEGIKFYYEDFRHGFREAHDKARAQGIYCQKYCGCIYSMKPRLTKR